MRVTETNQATPSDRQIYIIYVLLSSSPLTFNHKPSQPPSSLTLIPEVEKNAQQSNAERVSKTVRKSERH